MANLWSGRFDTAPDAAVFEFGASFRFDRRLFEDDVTGSIAWARALARAGVLATDEARRIEETLAAILAEGRANDAFISGADEDVHSFVERLLIERLGDEEAKYKQREVQHVRQQPGPQVDPTQGQQTPAEQAVKPS